jgi:uncharacterized protein
MCNIPIEIVYAGFNQQTILSLEVSENTTVIKAIQQTSLLQQFPEIDLAKNKVGVFGKIVSLERILQAGDRIEIYRPLLIDPKQKRVAIVGRISKCRVD